MVMVYHFTHWPPFHKEKEFGLPYIPWGAQGVGLFFVISGFVILMTASKGGPRDFLVSRCARLFPAYWFCVAVTYLTLRLHGGINVGLYFPTPDLIGGIANLTMLQAFFGIDHVDASYWTLEYELAFYGFILFALMASKLHKIELWCLVWLAIDLVGIWFGPPDQISVLFMLRFGHLFVAGMMIFRLYSGNRRPLTWMVLIASCLWTLLFSAEDSSAPFQLSWISLVAAAVFWRPKILRWRLLTWGGTISYPLYLIHQDIGYVVMYWLRVEGLPQIAIFLLASAVVVGIAALIGRLVDRPGQRVLRRILARQPVRAALNIRILPPG